jgi:VanZ family protein
MASENEKGPNFWRTCVVVYLGVIFFASSIPVPDEIPDVFGLDKLIHFASYSVLGWLLARTFKSKGQSVGGGKASSVVFSCFLISFFFGAFIELWQNFIPGRSTSLADAIANGAGGLFGAYTFNRWF